MQKPLKPSADSCAFAGRTGREVRCKKLKLPLAIEAGLKYLQSMEISKNLAALAVHEFLHSCPALISICLFGSRARGDAHPKSDYDWYLVIDDSLTTLPDSMMSRLAIFDEAKANLRLHTETAHNLIIRNKSKAIEFETLHATMARDGVILFDNGFLKSVLSKPLKAIHMGSLRFEPIATGGEFIIYDEIARRNS